MTTCELFNPNKQKAIVSGYHALRARYFDLIGKRMLGVMKARIGEYLLRRNRFARYSYVVVLNEVEEVVEERRVSNEELKEFAEKYRGSKA